MATLTPVATGSVDITIQIAPTASHQMASEPSPSPSTTCNRLACDSPEPHGHPAVGGTYDFNATSASGRTITWAFSADTDNTLATLGTNGQFNALKGGTVQIIASVAADDTYSSGTISHALEITRLANTLALTSAGGGDLPATLEAGATHDFDVTSASSGAITWSVTDTSDQATDLATIDETSGVLTASRAGMIKVIASVAADDTYVAATASHTLEITRSSANLAFATHSSSIPLSGGAITLTATSDSDGAITWSSSDPTVATIAATSGNDRMATLNPRATGSVDITIEIAETASHQAASETTTIDINDLRPANLTFSGPERPAASRGKRHPHLHGHHRRQHRSHLERLR